MPPKRKQTQDMPQSPPKRVTRARAKKDVDSKPDKTRIMTPSAKASAQKASAAQPAKLPRSKAQEPEDGNVKHEPEVMQVQPNAEAPKTRGKAKATSKAPVEPPIMLPTAPANSTRSRSNKVTVTTTEEAQIPKPKGRPKRAAGIEAPHVAETVEKGMEFEVPAKATRGRAAAATANPPSTRTRVAAALSKKRVKFDDQPDQDKENQPVAANAKKEPETKATGLRAKPIRKPASTRGGARGTRATKQRTEAETKAPNQGALPLSPKKVTQVAKTPSVGSEDELIGDKTPLNVLSTSPSKIPTSACQGADPTLSKIEIERDVVPRSPTRDFSPGKLAVSPRKPPPSPFKNALKSSPRKIDLGSQPAAPKLDAPSSPSKSPLKESPRRINLGDLKVKPVLQWSKTPLKSSLLQSPARRLVGSSMKATSPSSSSKIVAVVPGTGSMTTWKKERNIFGSSTLTTESAASSPLRAARTPGQHPRVVAPIKEKPLEAPAGSESPSLVSQLEKSVLIGDPALEAFQASPKDRVVHEPADEATKIGSPQVNNLPDEDTSTLDPVNNLLYTSAETPQTLVEHPDEGLPQADASMVAVDNGPALTAVPESFIRPGFVLSSPPIANNMDDSESEDELATPQKAASPSPLKTFDISARGFNAPGAFGAAEQGHSSSRSVDRRSSRREQRASLAMTPLAMQMSSWLASSPEKRTRNQISHKRGIFSPANPVFPVPISQSTDRSAVVSPAKPCFFEDEMAVRDAEDAALFPEEGSTDELQDDCNDDYLDFRASQESHESETYGDENAVPEESKDLFVGQEEENRTLTCTPARIFDQQSREIHTVSKVPLRPAADDTPLIVPRQRSRSLAGPLSDISIPDRLSISRDSILSPILQDRNLPMSMLPGDPTAPDTPKTSTAGLLSSSNTPGRSVRKAGYSSVLKGAIVHVDVHTSEGADASGIFVDLLIQMGARCVKQWHWNPQGSQLGGPADSPIQSSSPVLGALSSKIGITHVVYKDGGKRTLEKVREAKGAVLCVGVGWVLDCEREDKWLDETGYFVDTSIVPRGGSRRRKSMEPRALANFNGNLVPAETPAKEASVDVSPTKEFLTFDTPTSRRETFEFQVQAPATPNAEVTPQGELGNDFDSPLSPTTPYYLSKGAKLVQQTCPPKQSQELFFPVSGKIEDQPNEAVRQRLLMARRKSLQWASKIQSPLGRNVSYGK
ncbi:MAG: hypothetical protein LQ343_001266 [Gyalolechia ehrenbergii]|nr:MAG: hypothetical protein LQ343_001266 [Gyalolechia ehrenbergii]